jgi:hypothetical protein
VPRRKQSPPSGRQEPGIDVLRTNGAAVQSWYRSFKADGPYPLIPCATLAEERLGLYLEYHPGIAYYQRADVKPSFIEANGMAVRIPVPLTIAYRLDGQPHDYYPDFVGLTPDGRLIVAEAGLAAQKALPEARAKAAAALEFVAAEDGEYWLGTETVISDRRFTNLQLLHAYRGPGTLDPELADIVARSWTGAQLSVRQIVAALAPSYGPELVEATAWQLAAEECAAGRLLVDLDAFDLSRDVPMRLTLPSGPIVMPPPLPSEVAEGTPAAGWGSEAAPVPELSEAVIDPESITDPVRRERFLENLEVWAAVRAGQTVAACARAFRRPESTIRDVARRAIEHGEAGLVPYAHLAPAAANELAFLELIARMLRGPKKLTAPEITGSRQLAALARRLTKEQGKVIPIPTIHTVRRLIREAKGMGALFDRAEHGRRPRRTPSSGAAYASRIPQPGLLCEVDEHKADLLVTTVDGYEIATRVTAAVLIDVKTGAVLSAIASPALALAEEDYMRLVKMAMEPKDRLKAVHGFEHDWPCTAKPAAIASDRGLIFTSTRARDVLVRRLNIRQRVMPPEAPSAKGTVEAFFGSLTRRLSQRVPGTTMGSPEERDAYDSEAEAKRIQITFEEFETAFYRWVVDVYLQDWDNLRGKTRIAAWREAVEAFGVPTFTGRADELKLLLLKPANRRTPSGRYPVHRNGVSFLGLWYRAGSEGLAKRLRGKAVEIYYDRRDVITIYVAIDGAIVGSLTARELAGQGRISEWELKAARKAVGPERRTAVAGALRRQRDIVANLNRPRGERRRAALALARSAEHDRQLADIHPDLVMAERLLEARRPEPVEPDPPTEGRRGPDNVRPVRAPNVITLQPKDGR